MEQKFGKLQDKNYSVKLESVLEKNEGISILKEIKLVMLRDCFQYKSVLADKRFCLNLMKPKYVLIDNFFY